MIIGEELIKGELPSKTGKFRIIGETGTGSMGTVYPVGQKAGTRCFF